MKPRHIGMACGLLGLLALVGCSSSETSTPPDPGKLAEAKASQKKLPSGFKLGKPYQIKGKWYYPEYDPHYSKVGIASWYGDQFQGLATANGEVFDKNQISAAHPTLPIPSIVRVTNLDTGRSLIVRVNDRGPFHGDREIDLSQAAARQLGYERIGLAHVRVDFLGLADGIQPPSGLVYANAKEPAAQAPRSVLTATMLPDNGTPKPPINPPVPGFQEVNVPEAATALDIDQGKPVLSHAVANGNNAVGHTVPVSAMSESRPRRMCVSGPQFVQVGAFADTERVRMAQDAIEGLGSVRTEPVFINQRAAMRVRLGPLKDHQSADHVLSVLQSRGYGNAFVVPAVANAPNVPC